MIIFSFIRSFGMILQFYFWETTLNLSILFGGVSFEHEISIVSAIALKKLLGETQTFIFLDENRDFYLIEPHQMQSKYFSSKAYTKSPKIYLKKGGFYQKSLLGEKALHLPMVLNLIHGGDGEDGKISALLDFFEIAYIGPRLNACVLSFDKEFTKFLAQNRQIPTLPFWILYRGEALPHFDYPIIVKPARLGSSIGISVVKSQEELQYALDVAFEFDNKVMIEPFISGIKEYNLAGYKGKEGFCFSILEEPQKKEFLDFEKKYLDFSRTQSTQEADISPELKKTLQEYFIKIYDNLFEGALIRCDFFIKEGTCYLNEINPIPGSMANYLFKDFKTALSNLSNALPKEKNIKVQYNFLHQIQFAKGK